MIRNLVIAALSLALLVCVYGGVFRLFTADTAEAMTADRPELEWLRREYAVSDEQFASIKQKHEAHDIICRQLCLDLVNAKKQLDAAITNSPKMSSEVQEAFTAWAEQRRNCREKAIEHMYDVSSVMTPEAAERYRARIYETLIVPGRMPHVDQNGKFHEELIEHAAK